MSSAERMAIEATYEDTCMIYRTETRTVDNIADPVKIFVAGGVICALSQKSLTSSNQTDAQNEVSYEIKLFLPPGITILPGDEIAVKRFGRSNPVASEQLYSSAGQPMLYATHQEVIVKARSRA